MAGFKTHITTSTLLGVGYGAGGYYFGIPLETCMLGAGLCSVSGMLPDLDSDSGIPLRETSMFAAAIVPILMLDRFRDLQLSVLLHKCDCLLDTLMWPAVSNPSVGTTDLNTFTFGIFFP